MQCIKVVSLSDLMNFFSNLQQRCHIKMQKEKGKKLNRNKLGLETTVKGFALVKCKRSERQLLSLSI